MSRTVHRGKQVRNSIHDGRYSGLVSENFIQETSGNTATVVKAIPLLEGQVIYVEARALCALATGLECFRGRTAHAFRLNASDVVTAVGSATSETQDDMGGTPTLTIVANTGDQTVDVVVTGEAAHAFVWAGVIEYQILDVA